MKYFYYNHVWEQPETLRTPTVYRARWRYQPGLSHPRERRIKLPGWLIDCAVDEECGEGMVPGQSPRRPRLANELHLYRPDTEFVEFQPAHRDRHNCFVLFSGGELGGLDRLFAPGETFLSLLDGDQTIIRLIEELAKLGALAVHDSFWEAQLLLFQIIARFHATYHPAAPNTLCRGAESVAGTDLVRRAELLLKSGIGNPPTCEELARKLDVSPSTLSHRFRREKGESVMKHLMELRIEQAKNLLEEGLSLSAIAAQTGFGNPFHFSRAFKRTVGLSPSKYRTAGNPPSRSAAQVRVREPLLPANV